MSNHVHLRPPDTRAARRRVSLTDRVALRLGLWLILWSRRTRRTPRPRVDPALRVQLEREREQREAAALALMRAWR
ncbi:hypothetical protein [Curtobacterium sp. MCBA15_001]|uniref:hypothetical protein n=1 Tax=Curtobacterium sp. MCBA15_001 TaxID=1898731 RepID=UPI001113AAEC|nr:hypothetical protein [Curtobacterium sp. MCBA15_001]